MSSEGTGFYCSEEFQSQNRASGKYRFSPYPPLLHGASIMSLILFKEQFAFFIQR